MEGACLFLVMLSFILPSPITFTVNGLPKVRAELTSLLGADPYARESMMLVHTCDVFICKFDVDDVISWFSGAVSHPACTVLHVLTLDVHFARTLDRQPQSSVTYQ